LAKHKVNAIEGLTEVKQNSVDLTSFYESRIFKFRFTGQDSQLNLVYLVKLGYVPLKYTDWYKKCIFVKEMASKAEITTQFIIEKVAPVFNKLGYVGTSMADITKVTGLTKGAIYGNFENKEHLAIEVFNYTIRKIVWKVADEINREVSASAKLKAMTRFYREYYVKTLEFGGCPLLNVGVDTNNLNPKLHDRVTAVMGKLQHNIGVIVQQGIDEGEFREDLNAEEMGSRLLSHIQGAIFTSVMMKDPNHIFNMMDFLDGLVDGDMKR